LLTLSFFLSNCTIFYGHCTLNNLCDHRCLSARLNSLPDSVRNPDATEAAFRHMLKTFVFAWY